MQVENVHERHLEGSVAEVGQLLDSLSDQEDQLWPVAQWPRMQFDRPLQIGADGGHGPIRYRVDEYTPGRRVRFRFTGPKGFDGWHEFTVSQASAGCDLRNTLVMRTHGLARFSWPLVFGPLHDALIEDSLDRAERSLDQPSTKARWSIRVRILRNLIGRRG